MRILVVDDHPDSLELLEAALQRDGHEVLRAESCQEALQHAASHELDLLITDLRLDDGSGWDLLAALQTSHPALPAIAISGLAFPTDVAKSQAAGFCEHLAKPVSLEQIRQAVNRWGGSRP